MSIRFGKMVLCAPLALLAASSLASAQSARQMDSATLPSDFRLGPGFPTAALVPQGYEEGYLPKLSDIDIQEIEQFARNSYQDLKDLLDAAATTSDYWEKRATLKRGIEEIIQKSKPLKTELLMRNVLERAIIMVKLIDLEVDGNLRRKGVIDQEVRLMRESIKTSMRYWEPYLNHVNGQTLQANVDLAKINYRDFGVNYSNLLWSVANSIFDASAEYKLRLEALKLLMWDLYRDENKLELNQAGAIAKLYNFVKFAPDTTGWSDDQYVDGVKRLRTARNEAMGRLNEAAGPRASVSPTNPRGFKVGDLVMVRVAQGRTTGRIIRLDGDGFAIVQPGAGYSNYEGPVGNVQRFEAITQHDGFRLGEVVAYQNGRNRVTGRLATMFRIDGGAPEVTVVASDPSNNFAGPLSALIKTSIGVAVGDTVLDRGDGSLGEVKRILDDGRAEVYYSREPSRLYVRSYPDQLAKRTECYQPNYCVGSRVVDRADGQEGKIEQMFENGVAGVKYDIDSTRLYWRTVETGIRAK